MVSEFWKYTAKQKLLVVGFIVFVFPQLVSAQTAREVAVEIKASWISGLGIKLDWRNAANTTSYDVYKRSGNSWVWKKNTTGLTWTDSFATEGTRYEYRVARNSSAYSFTGNGYISAGFKIPAAENLGTVLLVVDSNYSLPLGSLIAEYKNQLTKEGWNVSAKSFLRTSSVSDIKNWIKGQWDIDSIQTKAVILLGKIPVPYSGNFRPDGHTDHTGAWPADMYFGTFWSSWTDVSVNNSSATRTENRNIPGDGKFDRSYINPSGTSAADIRYVQLPVGRIDLSNMPYFGRDTALVQRYLQKNLKFRNRTFSVKNQFLIDDNFGFFAPGGEAFASGGFRNFATMGYDSIEEADYVTKMKSRSYLFSYGCGAGTYDAASGIGDYKIFNTDSLLNPFTMLFGSYFGDWDNENAFLRAPLAGKGWGLVSVWSGRPYWMFHHCSLGEPLYKAGLSSYNSYNIYNVGLHSSGVHTSMQGDPTLSLYPLASVTGLAVDSTNKRRVKLQWSVNDINADSIIVEQYNNGIWKRKAVLAGNAVSVEFETDRGWLQFSVRPKKLIQTSSGTFWQLGARSTLFATSLPYIKYYVKSGSTSDLKSLSSWSSTANGTGASPADFGSDKEFVLSNSVGSVNFQWNSTSEIQGKITVPVGATLQLNSGVNLKITGELENDGIWLGASGSTLEIVSILPQTLGGSMELSDLKLNCTKSIQCSGILGIQGALTLTAGQLYTQGNLFFRSNSTSTGILLAVGSGASIIGTATTEQYIPAKRAFRLLSPTITTSTGIFYHWQESKRAISGLGTHITGSIQGDSGFDASGTGNPSLFTYSNSNGNWGAVVSTLSQNLVAGTPYRLLVRGDRTIPLNQSAPTATATVLRATGQLYVGSKTESGLSSSANAFNLIGNPYQAPVDMASVLSNATNVKSTYYHIWDPTVGARGAYVAVNVITNSNSLGSSATKLLQPGQACFVQTSSNGAASLTFTESSKSAGWSQVWRQELPFDVLTLQLYRGGDSATAGLLQDAVTVYLDTLEMNTNHRWNAGKLINQDENMGLELLDKIYSSVVVGIGLDTIPISLSQLIETSNRFTCKLVSKNQLTSLILWDIYRNIQVELDTGKSINYAWSAIGNGQDSNRFYLLVRRSSLASTATRTEELSTIRLIPNPVSVRTALFSEKVLPINTSITWTAMDGKLVAFEKLTTETQQLQVPLGISPGMYTVKLQGLHGTSTQIVSVE